MNLKDRIFFELSKWRDMSEAWGNLDAALYYTPLEKIRPETMVFSYPADIPDNEKINVLLKETHDHYAMAKWNSEALRRGVEEVSPLDVFKEYLFAVVSLTKVMEKYLLAEVEFNDKDRNTLVSILADCYLGAGRSCLHASNKDEAKIYFANAKEVLSRISAPQKYANYGSKAIGTLDSL